MLNFLNGIHNIMLIVVGIVALPFYFFCTALGFFTYALYSGFMEGWNAKAK